MEWLPITCGRKLDADHSDLRFPVTTAHVTLFYPGETDIVSISISLPLIYQRQASPLSHFLPIQVLLQNMSLNYNTCTSKKIWNRIHNQMYYVYSKSSVASPPSHQKTCYRRCQTSSPEAGQEQSRYRHSWTGRLQVDTSHQHCSRRSWMPYKETFITESIWKIKCIL